MHDVIKMPRGYDFYVHGYVHICNEMLVYIGVRKIKKNWLRFTQRVAHNLIFHIRKLASYTLCMYGVIKMPF